MVIVCNFISFRWWIELYSQVLINLKHRVNIKIKSNSFFLAWSPRITLLLRDLPAYSTLERECRCCSLCAILFNVVGFEKYQRSNTSWYRHKWLLIDYIDTANIINSVTQPKNVGRVAYIMHSVTPEDFSSQSEWSMHPSLHQDDNLRRLTCPASIGK